MDVAYLWIKNIRHFIQHQNILKARHPNGLPFAIIEPFHPKWKCGHFKFKRCYHKINNFLALNDFISNNLCEKLTPSPISPFFNKLTLLFVNSPQQMKFRLWKAESNSLSLNIWNSTGLKKCVFLTKLRQYALASTDRHFIKETARVPI